MTEYCLELSVYLPGSKHNPELSAALTQSNKREIGDTLIALGILLKDRDLPERDASGRFLKKLPSVERKD